MVLQSKKRQSVSNKKRIEYCNSVLVNHEHNCQCFNNNNYPSKNIKKCAKLNSKKCKEYNACKRYFKTFMNGSEPIFRPTRWDKPLVLKSHNCYAYALDDHYKKTKTKCKKIYKKNKNYSKCSHLKPQPGYHSKVNSKKYRKYDCKNMMYKIMRDNKSIIPIKFNRKCPKNYYKAAIVIDPEHTYHFYRQDKNVRWSHKPGTLKVTNKDASGNPIYAPHLSDRNYNKDLDKDGIDYTKFCNYFCVPKNSFKKTKAI